MPSRLRSSKLFTSRANRLVACRLTFVIGSINTFYLFLPLLRFLPRVEQQHGIRGRFFSISELELINRRAKEEFMNVRDEIRSALFFLFERKNLARKKIFHLESSNNSSLFLYVNRERERTRETYARVFYLLHHSKSNIPMGIFFHLRRSVDYRLERSFCSVPKRYCSLL